METIIQSISILGSGWLGYSLALQFLNMGYEVHASTRSKKKHAQLIKHRIKPYIIDIDQLNASRIDLEFFNSSLLIINIPSKNIAGFEKLVTLINSGQVKHLVFVSSTSVYLPMNKPIKEDDHDALNTNNPLLTIEHLFTQSDKFKTTVIRFGGLIGNSRDPARFFQSGKVIASPLNRVNLIHHDDCIAIISRIIEQKIWGETFNACADLHPTKADFYSQAAIASGLPAPTINHTSNNSGYKIIDNSKIKKYLDYQFIYADPMKMLTK